MSEWQRRTAAALRDQLTLMGQRQLPSNRDGFDEEFDSLRALDQRVRSNHDEFYTASLGSNMSKNRYREILPNEGTRVQLDPINNRGDGDFINANYVDGRRLFGVPFVYIATQAPLRASIGDFWRMAFENQVSFIVMLCGEIENGKVKSERYWPDGIGGVMTMGPLTLTLLAENHRHDTIYRTIQLRTADGTEREVFHLQYVRWPDQGIPQTSAPLMEIIRTLGTSNSSVRTPIVVHCSGGVGRTGVFIALHVVLAMFQTEQPISIPKIVQYLKFCRSGMVQRKDQYLFLYFAALREMEKMIWSIESARHAHGLPPKSNVPQAAIEDGEGGGIADDERHSVRRRPPQHVAQHPLQVAPTNAVPKQMSLTQPSVDTYPPRSAASRSNNFDFFGPTVQSGYYNDRSSSNASQSMMPLTPHGGAASDIEMALRNMQIRNQSQRRTPSQGTSRGASQQPIHQQARGGARSSVPPPQYEGPSLSDERMAAVSTRLPLDTNANTSSPVHSRGGPRETGEGHLPSPIDRRQLESQPRPATFVSSLFGTRPNDSSVPDTDREVSRRGTGVEVRNIRPDPAASDDDFTLSQQQRRQAPDDSGYFFSPHQAASKSRPDSADQLQSTSDLEAASRTFNASIFGSNAKSSVGGGAAKRSDVSLL